MFIVVQKLTVQANQANALVKDLSARNVLKEQPGFIDLTVSRSEEDSNAVSVIGRWESKADWQAWEDASARQNESKPNDYELTDFQSETFEVDTIIEK